VLEDVHDLQLVLTLKLLFANALEISDCHIRSRTGARHVEREKIFIQKSSASSLRGFHSFAGRPTPKNTPQALPLRARSLHYWYVATPLISQRTS
jgi:hypothetical protein